jgi:hypothetical protein
MDPFMRAAIEEAHKGLDEQAARRRRERQSERARRGIRCETRPYKSVENGFVVSRCAKARCYIRRSTAGTTHGMERVTDLICSQEADVNHFRFGLTIKSATFSIV